jgi:YggT family protein
VNGILCQLGTIYLMALFARIILSWFPLSPNGVMASVFSFLYTITEPVLGPIRRMLPPVGVGGMGLDLSPLIVILLLQVVILRVVC